MTPPDSLGSRPAVELEFEAARKILRMHFRGVVTAEHMRANADSLRSVLKQIGPGFSVVTNLTDLEEMEIESVPDITGMMDLFLASGVKQIIRVIPNPAKDIGFRLLSITHYRGRVPMATCLTISEAEEKLRG